MSTKIDIQEWLKEPYIETAEERLAREAIDNFAQELANSDDFWRPHYRHAMLIALKKHGYA